MDGTNNKNYQIIKECKNCNSTWLRIKLSATIDIPIDFYMHLSKELIMDENTSIGINWYKHIIYCPACGWGVVIDIP